MLGLFLRRGVAAPPALPPQCPVIPPLALRDIDVKTLAHLISLLRECPN